LKPGPVLLAGVILLTTLVSVHPAAVTAQDDVHPANACSAPYYVTGAGWDFCWQQDNARVQGLEITRAFFQGQSVIWRMGVPFTLTQYDASGTGPFKDVLGTPGGGIPGYGAGAIVLRDNQCPRYFGQQGQLFQGNRVCVEHREGAAPAVAVWSRFNVFNYRFLQGWIFDSRGTIEPILATAGNLIDGGNVGAAGKNHHHHLYWRIDLDVAAEGNDMLQVFQRVPGGIQGSGNPLGLGPCSLSVPNSAWCNVPYEGKLYTEAYTQTKWRVADIMDKNSLNREKSFEFTMHSDSPTGDFGSFDVMLVQYKGDTVELGYEVPTNPQNGDVRLNEYILPPEPVTDPVAWVVMRVYHDTRDEERPNMPPHYSSFEMRPRNFLSTNPGESTYPWN
jgi:hypothetical protein